MSSLPPDSSPPPRDADLHAFFQAHGPALRRYLAKHVRSEADREDLEQEVYLRLTQSPHWQTADEPEAFVITIARNLIIDLAWRQRVRQHGHHVALDPERDHDQTPSIEQQFGERAELQRVIAAIQHLKEPARRAFILHRFEDMTYGQIAAHMGISIKTVEKYISQCLQALRQSLHMSVGEARAGASTLNPDLLSQPRQERTDP